MAPVTIRRISKYFKSKFETSNSGITSSNIRKRLLVEDEILVTSRAIKLYLARRNAEINSGVPMPKARARPEKRMLTKEHLVRIDNLIEFNHEVTAPEIQKKLEEEFGMKVSVSTVKRARKQLGWTRANSRYCQIVRDVNREKRKIYCVDLLRQNEQFNDMIFTDESTIKMQANVKLSFRRRGCRRRLKGVPKHPYQVHVWAGISRRGATKIAIFTGRMVSDGYQDILHKYLLPFVGEAYPDGYRLYQDNDPKHVSKSTKSWFVANNVTTVASPPESPDLNPIEFMWATMKYHLRKSSSSKQRATDQRHSCNRYINRYINHLFKVVPAVAAVDGAASGY